MMGTMEFRIWFGDRSATADELSRVEQIDVTQEIDAFWEARVRMALCLDAKGRWQHWPGDLAAPFSRLRVEVNIGNGTFVPLIDGPLASVDAGLDAQPGRSTATMVVRDDSAFLDRDEEVEPAFQKKKDSDIVRDVFRRFAVIASTRILDTDAEHTTTMRRGTALTFLRKLARNNDRHAYVLPGEKPGKSVGCFLSDPKDAADLPPLVMIGVDRNLAEAHITEDPRGGERTHARVLRLNDQSEITVETSAKDLGLMRDLPARPADLTPRRLLHPTDNHREDPQAAASGQARRRGYVYHLKSRVVPGCYGAVLTPYQKVRVDAGATAYSGDYLITKVLHSITPSLYVQELEAKTDSASDVSGKKTSASAISGIF
jgi:hypothetical protein